MTDPLMTDPLSLAELLDTNTYKQNPPKIFTTVGTGTTKPTVGPWRFTDSA